MYKSTKLYVKRKILQVCCQCEISLEDVQAALDELKDNTEQSGSFRNPNRELNAYDDQTELSDI